MASITENELKSMTQEERVKALGMTSEQLTGRSMFMEFDPGETNDLNIHGLLKLISIKELSLILQI